MDLGEQELRKQVVRPTLKVMGVWSDALETLLIETALVETYLTKQRGDNESQSKIRSEGIFGISPITHRLVWDKYIAQKPDLASNVRGLASQRAFLIRPHAELRTNLAYASAIAAVIYLKTEKPLPATNDLKTHAQFWRRHYHSCPKGTLIDFYNAVLESDQDNISLSTPSLAACAGKPTSRTRQTAIHSSNLENVA
ncbi:MAG: hypothetical protein H7A00_02490 [Hahellaceae bacterium]|nr:hypothetical protein [Hahellaceae bacterium]